MAWIYSVSVECGDDESAARACAEHLSLPEVEVDAQQSSEDGAWWAVAVPEVPESAAARTAAGLRLFERLRQTPPPFRFALAGVEAFEAISFDLLDADLGANPTFAERYHGLVVSDEIRERLGSPAGLEPFAPGYSWFPYRGE